MTKLSPAQIALLTAAAKSGFTAMPAGDKPAVRGLLARGLMAVDPQDEGHARLAITALGREAVGAPDEDTPAPGAEDEATAPEIDEPPAVQPASEEAEAAAADPASASMAAPKDKVAGLVALLRRPEGASIDELMAATGWQPHSVRGALSGAVKKGLGLPVVSEKIDGVRRYRLEAQA